MVSKLEREMKDPFKKAGCDRMVVYSPEMLRSAMFNEIIDGNVENLRLCVERGASVIWRDEGEKSCGLTTLQAAICSTSSVKDKTAVIHYLLSQNLNINDIDYVETTALHFAAAVGSSELLDVLLKKGANPQVYDAENLTPLHLAVNNGHLPCVRALLSNWASPEVSDLDISDPADEIKDCKTRVSVPGASLYIAKRGTPLHACAATNRMSIARYLLLNGKVDVNNSKGPHGCTPLHIACRAGYFEMCKLLIDSNADLCAKDESGEEPLHRAIENGDMKIAEVLLKSGADANAQNNAGITPLHLAAAFSRRQLLPLLISHGADLNACCTKVYEDWDGGRTPIHYAAHNGDFETFKYLIELGAQHRAVSLVGWPSLFYAVEANHQEIVDYIVEMDLKDGLHFVASKSRTPLMVAAMQGAVESAEILMKKYPFTINWKDDTGRTALHWGAIRSQGNVMEKIIEYGGDKNIKDNKGATAGDLFTNITRPSKKRQWEEERHGPQGETVWSYKNVMENTSLRYTKRIMSARRPREIAKERQCDWCMKYTYQAKRCSACKETFYCSSQCQRNHWFQGGHKFKCITKGVSELVAQHLKNTTFEGRTV